MMFLKLNKMNYKLVAESISFPNGIHWENLLQKSECIMQVNLDLKPAWYDAWWHTLTAGDSARIKVSLFFITHLVQKVIREI